MHEKENPNVIVLPPGRWHPSEADPETGLVELNQYVARAPTRCKLHVAFPNASDNPIPKKLERLVDLAVGETIDLPRRYHTALHQVVDGHIVGGEAPGLELVGQGEPVPLHPVLVKHSEPAIFTPRTTVAPTSAEERLMAAARARREARS